MNGNSLLLHPTTKLAVENYTKQPAQALLIIGPDGAGKQKLAHTISAQLLAVPFVKLHSHPYFIEIKRPAKKQEIPIADIRELIKKLVLKTPGENSINRVVFVSDAQYLSEEAQNALLKILEEPVSGTIFILTAPSKRALLPTVASRMQLITIHSLPLSDVMQAFGETHQKSDIESAWRLSGGAAELLESILSDSDHPLKKSIDLAKQFLSADAYTRLQIADETSKNRDDMSNMLGAIDKLLEVLQRSANNQSRSISGSLIKNRHLVNNLQRRLDANASLRLIALELALRLRT